MNRWKIKFFVLVALIFAVGISGSFAKSVDLDFSVSNPYLLVGERQTVFLKVSLTGGELESSDGRPPANVAIVLDRSGSMSGDKIVKAKEAALMAVDMLEPQDFVSIVTYSDGVSVLVPATRVNNRWGIRSKINSIFADGNTALFAGVSKGADEVSKYFDINRVNRVILLSDGLANVGPSSPSALGALGESLLKAGISVTTIGLGLGYNEDLMVTLARNSDGNHAFVENSYDLVRIFEYEFRDILSVIAQNVDIKITCTEGVRPIRILGRDGDIYGQRVTASMNQLYSNQEKYLLVELEVPAHPEGENITIATVDIEYGNMETRDKDFLSAQASVAFTVSEEEVQDKRDTETLVEAVRQIANEASQEAIQLRDEGRIEEAKAVLQKNSEFLFQEAEELAAPELEGLGASNMADAEVIEDEYDWNANRKRMKAEAYSAETQQSY